MINAIENIKGMRREKQRNKQQKKVKKNFEEFSLIGINEKKFNEMKRSLKK